MLSVDSKKNKRKKRRRNSVDRKKKGGGKGEERVKLLFASSFPVPQFKLGLVELFVFYSI